MKNSLIYFLVIGLTLLSFPVFSQTGDQAASDTALLGPARR